MLPPPIWWPNTQLQKTQVTDRQTTDRTGSLLKLNSLKAVKLKNYDTVVVCGGTILEAQIIPPYTFSPGPYVVGPGQ